MARGRKTKFRYKIYGAALIFIIALYLAGQGSGNNKGNGRQHIEFDIALAIPRLPESVESQTIEHAGYTVSYNSGLRNANWVAYELTGKEVQGKEPRNGDFIPDPEVKGEQACDDDYRHSGWDRGHLAPAADMKWSKQAMEESFYLSNISPQNHNLNSGVWKSIEELTRNNASRYGKVLVVTGPVFRTNKGKGTIGKNRVVIPDAFYKILLIDDGGPKGIGFYCENAAGKKKLETYARSIDEIEEITGIDFFYRLPDELEAKVECRYDWGCWKTGNK